MQWKRVVKDYLSLTRKDRIGIIVLSSCMLLVLFLPKILTKRYQSSPGNADTSWITAIRRLEEKDPGNEEQYRTDHDARVYQYDRSVNNYADRSGSALFFFDPNTLSPEGWKKLGLRDKTIRIIQNYLGKGGQFKKPEDLQKVYGLHRKEYERLVPFVKIEENKIQEPRYKAQETRFKESSNQVIKVQDSSNRDPAIAKSRTAFSRYSFVDVNTADTSAFISLPGIGSKLAGRIIIFREKLGGFYSVEQVGETFGLPDSTFQKIKQYLKLENSVIKKININTATIDELKTHPYIRWSIANPIVAFRKEHGPFLKIEDIKKVMAVTEEVYRKIGPYLTTN